MELKSRELQFTFNGKQERLRYPTVKDLKAMRSDNTEDDVEKGINFLMNLGLSQDTADNLEVVHLNTIVETLTASEKK